MNKSLEHFSHAFAKWVATSKAFGVALGLIMVLLLVGIHFHFSNSWQNSLNTFISLLTFLMLFIMQRSDKKALQAIQVKLNELIASQNNASNTLINIENASEAELEAVQKQHAKKSEKL